MEDQNPDHVRASVAQYYGETLQASTDLQTNACCAAGQPPQWIQPALAKVHPDVSARFYGCGFPIPHAIEGAAVLDLGCGTGRDVFVLAQLVGSTGKVIGLDMTEEQLAVARATQDWHAEQSGYDAPNTRFVHGVIEDLQAAGIADASLDLIVSNCVVNLSPRKDLVLAEAFRALRPGAEFYLSDVVADRRLPEDVVRDPLLYAECLGGAMYRADFAHLARRVGFLDPRVVSVAPIAIHNHALRARVGAAQFFSVTYRLFKLAGLDPQCEDYGQVATYLGGIPGAETVFWLDDHHAFEAHCPERVCANTAQMLAGTRFSRFFRIQGSLERHFGVYPCGPTMAAARYAPTGATASGSCC